VKNYKMIVCYDGTRYSGWERQVNRETIQGKLENVLARMCDKTPEEIKINGAGRTDAGVHARAMVFNVFLEIDKEPEEIRDYMNRYLPEDIAVLEVRVASDRFHARYNAIGKTYCYTCYVGKAKPVFDRKYVTKLDYEPDIQKMKAAAEFLQGKHDFYSFCGNSKIKKSTIRIVDKIEIKRSGDCIAFLFHGNGFLQNMVRILVGTLLEVGKGAMQPEDMVRILQAKDRKLAGPTAPSCGLCLIEVDYQ